MAAAAILSNGKLETLLTIIGVDGTALTVIDGNGTVTGDRVFHVLDPAALGLTASFSTLTIRGGRVINENGGRTTITKFEAALKQLVNKAASGDHRAIQELLALQRLINMPGGKLAGSFVKLIIEG